MTPPTWLHWPASWTPADLADLVAWYDAADANTLFDATSGGSTPSNGGAVARWEDKSGNAYHLTQATAGLRPSYQTSGINSQGALQFNSDALARSVNLGTADVTVAVVSNQSAGNYRIVDKRGTGGTGTVQGWHVKPNTAGDAFIVDEGNGDYYVTQISASLPTTYVLLCTSDANRSIYLDGSDVTTFDSSSGTVTDANNSSVDLCVGANSNGQNTQMMNGGDIGEIVIADAVLSTSDREKLEGYLAHKWGLESNLPSTHPFRYSAP